MNVALTVLVLSACSPSPETEPQIITTPDTPSATTTQEQQTTTPEETTPEESSSAAPSTAVRSVDYSQLEQVSLSYFASERGGSSFKFVNGNRTSECFAYSAAVTCIGTADSSVPDVDLPPFSGRPGAVGISADGLAYTIVEGVPPARYELKVGQWVDFGGARCAKPDSESLVCNSDTAAFEVAGEAFTITTEGPVFTSEELAALAESRTATEFHTGTDVLVRGQIMCGAMEGHRLAEVMTGEITCAEAMDVLDRYDARKYQEGTGNTLMVSFDGWICASPTYGRSQELRASTVCEDVQRGITIHDPQMVSASH